MTRKPDKRHLQAVEEAPPPTKPMLSRVEAALNDPDALAAYAEMLTKEVEAAELERAERHEEEPEDA